MCSSDLTILSYQGSVNGIGASDGFTDSVTSTSATARSITAFANSLVASFFAGNDSTLTPPAGGTVRANFGTAGSSYILLVHEHGPVSAGATVAKVATMTVSERHSTATVEIRT